MIIKNLLLNFIVAIYFLNFIRWELKKIMRQNPDEIEYIKLLEYIRNHPDDKIKDNSILQILHNQFIPGTMDSVFPVIDDFVGKDSPDGMVITFTNAAAKYYNSLVLNSRINYDMTKLINIDAKFFVNETQQYRIGNLTNYQAEVEINNQRRIGRLYQASETQIKLFKGAMKKYIINSIIPFHITIAEGSRIMLLQNIDISCGLINGARGTFIEYIPDIDAMKIKFDIQEESEESILIKRRKSVELQLNEGKKMFMYQFPIKLVWAVTAHKSQGQTLERAAINVGEPAFAHGSLYVVLSRVKSLKNILLFGLSEWPTEGPQFHINPYIQNEQNAQAENDF